MMMASTALTVITLLVLPQASLALTNANEFLRAFDAQRTSEYELRASLLNEIESSLPDSVGNGSPSARFGQLEAMLQPIYAALPKNQYGNLEHHVARYGLHRLFMLRHGWTIKGLGPSSGKFDVSSPAGILQDQVPSFVADLFEKRLGGKGFKLHDLAILAATIEHLIQEESVQRLSWAYKIYENPVTGALPAGLIHDSSYSTVKDVLDTFMAGFIVSENLTTMTELKAQETLSQIAELFAHWNETQDFLRDTWTNVTQNIQIIDPSARRTDFPALTKVIESVGDQFGSFFHSTVCNKLKDKLMSLEYHGTGRIKLSEFYKPVFDGFWQFQESVGYLRELGVLEETDPKEPSIMIANYMNAPTNCIAYSGFYAACCKNECEGLLGHIEEKVAAPVAEPSLIAALIADLASSTVPSPRILSSTLLRRLDEIAASHGGVVPLHGRLFAQWMHNAYPRECPYPHVSGTTSPKLPEEWLEASGIDSLASEEEMLQYIRWSRNTTYKKDVLAEDVITWSFEEELLVEPLGGALQLPVTAKEPIAKRSVVLFSIAGSLAYALVLMMKATLSDSPKIPEKFSI